MAEAHSESHCIYCFEPLCGEGSLEHIWPQSLGGAACGDLWRSNSVCRNCNSKAGLWVDGPFLKGAFTQHEKRLCNEAFVGWSVIDCAGYTFMGQEQGFPRSPDEVSEFWLGPSGEPCRFVHAKDPERWETYAGGNPIERKKRNPGRVYLSLVGRGSVRALIALASVFRSFPKARIHCLTELSNFPPELTSRLIPTDKQSEEESKEIDWICSAAPSTLGIRLPIDTKFEARFLAKLALGVGANTIGQNYLSTAYAKFLRDLVQMGEGAEVRGAGYTQPRLKFSVGLKNAWTLTLWMLDGLVLVVSTPSGKDMTILVTPAHEVPSHIRQEFAEGQSWVVIPVRRFCSEAIALPNLIAHRLNNYPLPSLNILADWQAEADKLLADEKPDN